MRLGAGTLQHRQRRDDRAQPQPRAAAERREEHEKGQGYHRRVVVRLMRLTMRKGSARSASPK